MERKSIEALAAEVRAAIGETSPPVDTFRIAREEGILLAPGAYGEGFDGRIEYHRSKGKFILFYPEPGTGQPLPRVHFSVGHELGHYYLPAHRALLQRGRFHNSKAGFVRDNQLEREADFFAAALLVPEGTLKDLCRRKNFLTLKDILKLARQWQASATCTAVRYAQFASEPCAVLVSEDGETRFYVPSEGGRISRIPVAGDQESPEGNGHC